MKRFTILTAAILLTAATAFSQQGIWTAGLITSHFNNFESNQRIDKMDNPHGYGLVVGYNILDKAALSVTGEYLNGNIQDQPGDETSIRTSFSAHIFPVQFGRFRPYISGGLVYMHQSLKPENGSDDTDHLFQLRESVGVDIMLIQRVFFNFDLAAYTDGFGYLGSVNSFGFRYAF